MRLPVFTSLDGYQKAWLGGDVVAGLTIWAVIIPEALAYAGIAGVSPVVGLYAVPAALVLYAMFGSSKHLVVGPMAATAALSAAAVADFGGSADAATVTVAIALLTGVFAIIAGIVRFGFIANFISEPVMKGFIIGLALTIMAGQLPKLFGIEDVSGNFFEKIAGTVTRLGETNTATLAVGLGSLAIVLLLRKVAPRIPSSLVAVVLGILAVSMLGLDQRGVSIMGTIESGLPPIALPDLPLSSYLSLAAPAAGIMLVGFAEGLGAARTYATRNNYEVYPNRELIGLGAANLGSAFTSGMVVNGSLSKTAVNGEAGAKSQISGIVAAILTIATLLFLTGLFEKLPEATLAAIVITALIELVDFKALEGFYRASTSRLSQSFGPVASRPDFFAAVATLLGVLVFDTLPGLLLGVVLSVLLLLYRTSRPRLAELGNVPGTKQYSDVARNPENTTKPDTLVLRIEGGLFFANADYVRHGVLSSIQGNGDGRRVRSVVLDVGSVPFIDVTGARMIDELAEDMDRRGIGIALAREAGQVRDVVRRVSGAKHGIPLYPSVQAAVDALSGRSGDDG